MICTSCGKNRAELHSRQSRLMPGVTLLLCNACLEKKYEPRFIVILYGRVNGMPAISDYIANRKYVGAEITARELV